MISPRNIFAIVITILLFSVTPLRAKDVVWEYGQKITVCLPEDARPVLYTAADVLKADFGKVLNADVKFVYDKKKADIIVSIDTMIVRSTQGFRIQTTDKGNVGIVAHDSHGAAYGMMEISRLLGVSPWEWWADCTPEAQGNITILDDYTAEASPSVEYRGIFINDEDWGLMPWSCQNYEPADKGVIGPKTTSKIFELLLRLRANTYWPPMHECSVPFFLVSGNREIAEKYGIYIGGSHCEPMASSTAGEWSRRGIGEYDYMANAERVRAFWNERLKDVSNQEIIYTLGMRGVHDGAMQGANGVDQQKELLSRIISDQRNMLCNHGIANAPQVFIPYKEVLDIYNAGLEVPEDVTLMWCDDNYGYITHFPDSIEQKRKGGNGVYYHVSYWGRPHDYLWLGTFSPGLLYQQMSEAYNRGINKMWILNVGDIKPAEYQIELFMDMAWDFDAVRNIGVEKHAGNFLCREFGNSVGHALLPVMKEHYRLAHIRKPEFMGGTRTEEWDNDYYNHIHDLQFTETEIRERLAAYNALSDSVEKYEADVPAEKTDAYFQLVKYPVQATDQMNRKFLYAQLARHGKDDWQPSHAAYDSIQTLTARYNTPKWDGIMDAHPRKLPVFDKVEECTINQPLIPELKVIRKFDGNEGTGKFKTYEWLGYGNGAVRVDSGDSISFGFTANAKENAVLRICLLPTHSYTTKPLNFNVKVDGTDYGNIEYSTYGRSEEWKENKLCNQSVREISVSLIDSSNHTVTIVSNSDGMVLDQIILTE